MFFIRYIGPFCQWFILVLVVTVSHQTNQPSNTTGQASSVTHKSNHSNHMTYLIAGFVILLLVLSFCGVIIWWNFCKPSRKQNKQAKQSSDQNKIDRTGPSDKLKFKSNNSSRNKPPMSVTSKKKVGAGGPKCGPSNRTSQSMSRNKRKRERQEESKGSFNSRAVNTRSIKNNKGVKNKINFEYSKLKKACKAL